MLDTSLTSSQSATRSTSGRSQLNRAFAGYSPQAGADFRRLIMPVDTSSDSANVKGWRMLNRCMRGCPFARFAGAFEERSHQNRAEPAAPYRYRFNRKTLIATGSKQNGLQPLHPRYGCHVRWSGRRTPSTCRSSSSAHELPHPLAVGVDVLLRLRRGCLGITRGDTVQKIGVRLKPDARGIGQLE